MRLDRLRPFQRKAEMIKLHADVKSAEALTVQTALACLGLCSAIAYALFIPERRSVPLVAAIGFFGFAAV